MRNLRARSPVFTALGLATIAALPALFSGDSLAKGQVIKQFFAYSISESLVARPWAWLSTTLPCEPARGWVEEPPVFHSLAAMSLEVAPQGAELVPLLAYALLAAALSLWARALTQSSAARWLAWIAAACAPVFLRYSIQHLPDLLATAWLALGAYVLVRGRAIAAALLFTLAITTKALTGFAIVPLLAWHVFSGDCGRKRRAVRAALILGVSIMPFLAWLFAIKQVGVPNPFFFQSLIENRHSGGLSLLASPSYWGRFLTWVAAKGAGPILFAFAGFSAWKFRKNREWAAPEGALIAWSAGLIPYWLLVRQGNFVHDYYFLPFAAPIALLGAKELANTRRLRWLALLGILASAVLGIAGLARMKPVALPVGASRPIFCDYESAAQPS